MRAERLLPFLGYEIALLLGGLGMLGTIDGLSRRSELVPQRGLLPSSSALFRSGEAIVCRPCRTRAELKVRTPLLLRYKACVDIIRAVSAKPGLVSRRVRIIGRNREAIRVNAVSILIGTGLFPLCWHYGLCRHGCRAQKMV